MSSQLVATYPVPVHVDEQTRRSVMITIAFKAGARSTLHCRMGVVGAI
jgi:hypothetical protein